MEGVAYAEEFSEERPDEVTTGFLVGIAHAGRRIQKHHKIHRTACLTGRLKDNPKAE
jgi:hypothetical protein